MRLPVHQVCKGQPGPAKLLIQPDAEVMQGHLRGQPRLQPTELMGAFPIQAEGMMELVMDCLHNLADTREPAPPRLGPRPPTIAPRWTNNLGAVGRPPCRMVRLAFQAFVDNIRTPRRRPDTGQVWLALATQGKKGFG